MPIVYLIDLRKFGYGDNAFYLEKITGIENVKIIDHYQCGSFIKKNTSQVFIDMGWNVNIRIPNQKDRENIPGKEVMEQAKKERIKLMKEANRKSQKAERKVTVLRLRRDRK